MKFRRLITAAVAAALVVAGLAISSSPVGADATLAPANHDNDGLFIPLNAPVRVVDSRNGIGLVGRFTPGQSIDVTIAGLNGLPPANQLKAVALNATATQVTGNGYLTLWPSGANRPDTSNLNYNGLDVSNFVIVPVGANGKISVYNGANDGVARSALLLDVVGYYTTAAAPTKGGSFFPIATRLFDTRQAGPQRGSGQINFLAPGEWRAIRDTSYDPQFPVYVFNVTVTQSSGDGYLSVVPGNRVGSPPPTVSNLNFRSGFDVANMVIVKPDTNGVFSIYNGGSGALHVIFDFVGAYDNGTFIDGFPGAPPFKFTAAPQGPFRFSDTRQNLNRPIQTNEADGFTLTYNVAADSRIPANAIALVVNVTAIPSVGDGYFTVFKGPTRPDSSTLNFKSGPGVVVPNLTIVQINTDRTFRLFFPKGISTHALFDVMGWVE